MEQLVDALLQGSFHRLSLRSRLVVFMFKPLEENGGLVFSLLAQRLA